MRQAVKSITECRTPLAYLNLVYEIKPVIRTKSLVNYEISVAILWTSGKTFLQLNHMINRQSGGSIT